MNEVQQPQPQQPQPQQPQPQYQSQEPQAYTQYQQHQPQPQYQAYNQQTQPQTYGQPYQTQNPYGASQAPQKSKVAAGILGILLGGLGIHKFYLGYTSTGVIMLLISLIGGIFTLTLATWVIVVIGLVEGIIYLTKSDEAFYQTYELNEKKWF